MSVKNKKPYTSPKLVTHGNVETLTQTRWNKPPKGPKGGGGSGGGSHVFHK